MKRSLRSKIIQLKKSQYKIKPVRRWWSLNWCRYVWYWLRFITLLLTASLFSALTGVIRKVIGWAKTRITTLRFNWWCITIVPWLVTAWHLSNAINASLFRIAYV